MTFDSQPADSDPISTTYQGVSGSLQRTWRNLPHWQRGGSTYFLTYRCRSGLVLSGEERTIVLENWKHWHAGRYWLHAVVVMPDHVHVLMAPLQEKAGVWMSLTRILHTNKIFSSHAINGSRGRGGRVWQDGRFDRVVRDEREFQETWIYMSYNPVRSGLCALPEEYPWWCANLGLESADSANSGYGMKGWGGGFADSVRGLSPNP